MAKGKRFYEQTQWKDPVWTLELKGRDPGGPSLGIWGQRSLEL